jgi:hypothetical protein
MTTIKDQIPSFPKLISAGELMDHLAHGTTDFQRIDEKYYSNAERTHAEDLAKAKIMSLVQEGRIRATGRMSETKWRGSAARWEVQQYKNHSKVRTYIEEDFWRTAVSVKYGFLHDARIDGKEYTGIMLVLEDCVAELREDLLAHDGGSGADVQNGAIAAESNYSTPYIDLMWQAIEQFKITEENQPIKEGLVEWFLTQEIEGQKVSRSTAEYLASFVRLPASRLGGNRPWKVRALQPDHDDSPR